MVKNSYWIHAQGHHARVNEKVARTCCPHRLPFELKQHSVGLNTVISPSDGMERAVAGRQQRPTGHQESMHTHVHNTHTHAHELTYSYTVKWRSKKELAAE